MKKFFSFLTVALAILCTVNFCEAAEAKVALLPIENLAGNEKSDAAAKLIRSQFLTVFRNNKDFVPVTSLQIENEISAQAAGADYLIFGQISGAETSDQKDKARIIELLKIANGVSENGETISPEEQQAAGNELNEIAENPISGTLNFSVIVKNISSGMILFENDFSVTKYGKDENSALTNACKAVAVETLLGMTKNLSGATENLSGGEIFSATVGDMFGNFIYIDKGTASGIKKGETLTIIRSAGDIVINGKVVGKKEIIVGKATVTEIFEDYSTCKIDSKEIAVEKGDIVKRS